MAMSKQDEAQRKSIFAIKNKVGVSLAIKSLEKYDKGGSGNYVEEKYKGKYKAPSDEEIRKKYGF
ncbi:MAG: hypothetical protein K6F77_01960 [Lachnospiraceae bacterium]|nr:hypothetical protein [Lachnospiraceae bacterium]